MPVKIEVDVHEGSLHERCMYVNFAYLIKRLAVSNMLTANQLPDARRLQSLEEKFPGIPLTCQTIPLGESRDMPAPR
jgi:hypothetical protein